MKISYNMCSGACVALLASLFTACSGPDDATTDPAGTSPPAASSETQAPPGRLGNNVVPEKYAVELTVDPSRSSFSGTVVIDVQVASPTDRIWLHGKDLDVSEVYLAEPDSTRIAATYEQRLASGVSLLALEKPATAGPASIHFTYRADFNNAANALFNVARDGRHYAVTQFEPIAARQVFPGFDEPGFKVPFDITLVTRANDVAIATTPQASEETLADNTVRHVFETTRPLPTYLIAFAVGPYDVVDYGKLPANSVRHRELPLRGVAAHGQGEHLDYALKNTDGILTELEEYFGTPYPYKKLDLIAVPESFGGAMENVGAITYDEYLLLMDDDAPLRQRRIYTTVHAHEMGHMWFGNLVTPAWWNDTWLNEAFASWIMNKAADGYWPEGEFSRDTLKGALEAMSGDSLAAARQIREPIDRNDAIADSFDGITYKKGGGVLAMLERYVGEENFRAGVRLHMDRHRDGTATAEDFIASVAEGSDRTEIEGAFKSYIDQPGVPLMSVSLTCADGAKPVLKVRQSRYAPLGSDIDPGAGKWQVPLCVAYDDAGERKSSCTLITEPEQSVELEASNCPQNVMPNADGAGYYRFALDEGGWQALIEDAAKLPAAEALVLADSLDAAFRAQRVSATEYLSGMAALVNHDAWDVADAATDYLEESTQIIDSGEMPAVEQALRHIAKPRFEALAGTAGAGNELLQQRLQRFLVDAAKDPALREPLARQAAAALGLDGKPDDSAAPAGQLETILTVGVQELGGPFYDLLLKKTASSEDPAFRRAATSALARAEDPALVKKLQAALLAGDFQGTELARILRRQIARPETTELTYAWIKANDAAVIGGIPETFRSRSVPELGSSFCNEQQADDWQQFIVAHADSVPGYERSLAQAVESVRLCAALKSASADELTAAFAAY